MATMKSVWILPLTLLALRPLPAAAEPGTLERKGDDALAAGLWEMAAAHFSSCLSTKELNPEDKARVAIRLAEAWIRQGKPADALDLLSQSFISKHPETAFWKGQALASLGRLQDALALFVPLLSAGPSPHEAELVLTTSNLQLALGRQDEALATLSLLATGETRPASARARLHQVEILLDRRRYQEARRILPAANALSPADQALATYLDGQLLLAERKPEEAAARFQSLIDQPRGQSLRTHHLAAAGLARALKDRGTPETAVPFLLSFIQEHPDSPLLGTLFETLLDLLPASPTAADPILERITQWITPAEIPATGLVATSETNAAGAWPTPPSGSELLAHSLNARATGLIRSGTPAAITEASSLLRRLRLEFPSHPLADRALFQLALLAMTQDQPDRAFGMLDTLRQTTSISSLKGRAAFLEARAAYDRGDRTQASLLFQEAADALDGEAARAASLNAAVIRLTETPGSLTIQQPSRPADPSIAPDVELERALSEADPAKRRAAIEEFLSNHPEHPRVPEARLAAAECALAGSTPDLAFARAQLEAIQTPEAAASTPSPARLALLGLRIADLAGDGTAAIAAARVLLERFPADPAAAEAMLVLGRNLFETRSYNDARLILEKLAASDTDPGRAQAAWLLAARSAALVPTSQSQQEALILFDKAIEAKGPVSPLARLEKARLLIDMNRLPEAVSFLSKWFASLEEKDPLHLPAGLLLGEAVYARGGTDPQSLATALEVYDKLLVHAADQPAVFNRIQYLRGKTLEQIPDATDPSGKRERQAFIAYYSVLETETPPAEWHYFELCGFRALALLEKAGRWPAAIACAKKIASFKGPRAEEAATRASQLQLKHMIWED